jgi:hypothetical protein
VAEAWRGCSCALGGEDSVEAEVQLVQGVIDLMVSREGTLLRMLVPEQREDEDVVLIINPNYNFTVPGDGTSDGTSKPAGTSDDGARRQGTAARGRRRASTASSSDSDGTSTEEGADDSADPEDLVDEHGRLLVSQSTASGDYWEAELGPEPCDPNVY